MVHRTFSLAAVVLSGCSAGGSYEGVLVDGISGEARAGVTLVAKAPTSSDLTCQAIETATDPTGKFTLANTCKGDTYTLKITDETLLLANAGDIMGGEQSTGAIELQAWRAPAGSGVYILHDDALKEIRTYSDVGKDKLEDGTVVRYPSRAPGKVTAVPEGGFLVMAGEDLNKRMKLHSLIEDKSQRKFADGLSIEAYGYVGGTFNDQGGFDLAAVTVAEPKVKSVAAEGRHVRYLPHDAVPAGRYVILGETDSRLRVVDFGAAQAPVADAPAPAGG